MFKLEENGLYKLRVTITPSIKLLDDGRTVEPRRTFRSNSIVMYLGYKKFGKRTVISEFFSFDGFCRFYFHNLADLYITEHLLYPLGSECND